MSIEEIEDLLARLMRLPVKSQIKIDFDGNKKIFCLSAPVYRGGKVLPKSVLCYVSSRKDRTFEPHKTSFVIDENLDVRLVQEVPFQCGFQSTTRKLVLEFLQVAQKCAQMLIEMAAEDKLAELQTKNES